MKYFMFTKFNASQISSQNLYVLMQSCTKENEDGFPFFCSLLCLLIDSARSFLHDCLSILRIEVIAVARIMMLIILVCILCLCGL